ncbi:hypothetical protein [Virgibacillus halodenitrificans]|uniref:hypothetical protein n=1 Tax=Virgibacillus halodenitrificans TaxID=1482 RepID=UPI002DBB0F18|nr:hypothetical protein [Virgibacillus halodenitrificans]MEC2158009.1 hypothetical protein [Virgibacillus halodenitrificans]
MPGVKNNGVLTVKRINEDAYKKGKSEEQINFYLQQLMTFNPIQEKEGAYAS